MLHRENIARERGFALYREYGEEQAASFIGCDLTTLKRWRRAGKVKAVVKGERHIRYLGFQIADILLFGVKEGEANHAPINPAKPTPEQILAAAKRRLK